MKIRIPSKFVEHFLLYDALFIMMFCFWWSYSTKDSSKLFYGWLGGMPLLELHQRCQGKKATEVGNIILVACLGTLLIFAIFTALASLGIYEDGLSLLNH